MGALNHWWFMLSLATTHPTVPCDTRHSRLCGGGTGDRRLHDGQWHHVSLSYRHHGLNSSLVVELTVDNENPLVEDVVSPARHLDLDGNTSLGGLPPGAQAAGKTSVKEGFVGCMRKVRLDDVPLPILAATASAGVTSGCSRRSSNEKCTEDGALCGVSGTCHQTWFDLECRCDFGSAGDHCSEGACVPKPLRAHSRAMPATYADNLFTFLRRRKTCGLQLPGPRHADTWPRSNTKHRRLQPTVFVLSPYRTLTLPGTLALVAVQVSTWLSSQGPPAASPTSWTAQPRPQETRLS